MKDNQDSKEQHVFNMSRLRNNNNKIYLIPEHQKENNI